MLSKYVLYRCQNDIYERYRMFKRYDNILRLKQPQNGNVQKKRNKWFLWCQHWHWHRIKANHFIYDILQKIRIYLLIKICAWHGVNFSTENARILQHHSCQIFSGHPHTYTHIFTPNQVALSNRKRIIGGLYTRVSPLIRYEKMISERKA